MKIHNTVTWWPGHACLIALLHTAPGLPGGSLNSPFCKPITSRSRYCPTPLDACYVPDVPHGGAGLPVGLSACPSTNSHQPGHALLLYLPGNICSHLLACLPCYSTTTFCPGHLFAHWPKQAPTTIWQPGLACLRAFHDWAMVPAGPACTHNCHVSGSPRGDLATPIHKSAVSESHQGVT